VTLVDHRPAGATTIDRVREVLVGDFLPMLVDVERSSGSYLWDEVRDGPVLDMGMYFSSAPLGHNPAAVTTASADLALRAAARVKPSNPDFANPLLDEFVADFRRVMMPDAMSHLFVIDGGALAVENALKVAFDWKAQVASIRDTDALSVLHLRHAFHGRSGYTLSLTNTDPVKTAGYPAFDWPRVPAPALGEDGGPDPDGGELTVEEAAALEEIEAVLVAEGHRIACFVYEPIQGEGGDRHIGGRFLRAVEDLCVRHDVLTVADEVQTGGGLVGRRWAHEALGLAPDLVAFGKRLQVCGVLGGRRVADLATNAFVTPSRISSTWGGSLVDMVRFSLLYSAIDRDGVFDRAAALGPTMRAGLEDLATGSGGRLSAPRSRGLWGALSVETPELRNSVVELALSEGDCVLLPCGTRSIRWRPSLLVTENELARSFDVVRDALRALGG
jgi:L-lysine 6-transaminase